jgi:hypothetical protein
MVWSSLGRWNLVEEEAILWFDPEIGTPMVSMAEYGLTFNRAAVEVLGKPWKIMLGFDKANKNIVVKPIRREHEDPEVPSRGLAFAERERDGYIRISSKDFVRFVARFCPELNLSRTVRYLAVWDEDIDLMTIDMNRPVDTPSD